MLFPMLILLIIIMILLTIVAGIMLYYVGESFLEFIKSKDPLYLLFSCLFLTIGLLIVALNTSIVLNIPRSILAT